MQIPQAQRMSLVGELEGKYPGVWTGERMDILRS